MFGNNLEELSSNYRTLGQLNDSGHSLEQILEFFHETAKPKFKPRIRYVRSQIKNGKSFSDALKTTQAIPAFDIAILHAGEMGGNLSQVAQYLSNRYESLHKLNKKMLSKMSYTILVFILANFILPLPRLVGGQISTTQYFFESATPIALLFIVWRLALALIRRGRLNPSIMHNFYGVGALIPVLATHLKRFVMERLCLGWAMSLEAGLPLGETLDVQARTTPDPRLSKVMSRLKREVETGHRLQDAISRISFFSPMFKMEINSGIESGNLPENLMRLADRYRFDLETGLDALTKWLPLVIYLIMAVYAAISILGGFTSLMDLGI